MKIISHTIKVAGARPYSTLPHTKITLDSLKKEAEDAAIQLFMRDYEGSAKSFELWLKKVEEFYDRPITELRQAPEFAFNHYVPDVIRAFIACSSGDGRKDHIERLIATGVEIEDVDRTTCLHDLAAHPSARNAKISESVLTFLAREKKQDLLLKKDILDDNPIEVAVLRNNTPFIKLAREICAKPTTSELIDMHVDYYLSLKDEVEPEMELLLFGQDQGNDPCAE